MAARGVPIATLLFTSLYQRFFGPLVPSWRQYMVHGQWRYSDTIFDGRMTPRQCGEEGAENVVCKMGKIARNTTGIMSRRGKTAEEAELEYYRNILQQLLFQSAVATSVAPPSLGIFADVKRSGKRLKQQLLSPFAGCLVPNHAHMTNIKALNPVTEADVADAIAGLATKQTHSSSIKVDISEIKFKLFTLKTVSNSDHETFTVVLPASRNYLTVKLGGGRGFKISCVDIIEMKAEGDKKVHLRVAAPVRKTSKNSPGRVPQSYVGGESALEVASVLEFIGGDNVVDEFKSLAKLNEIKLVDVISSHDDLTVEGIKRHESEKIANSAVGSNMPLNNMDEKDVKAVLDEAAAVEVGFYDKTSTPSMICCFCKRRVLYRSSGTDRVLPMLQDPPNTRHTFCGSVNLFEAGALADLEDENEDENEDDDEHDPLNLPEEGDDEEEAD